MSQLPTYDEVTASLKEIKAPLPAAETHGMMCGLICGDTKDHGHETWMQHALEQDTDDDTLLALFAASSQYFALNNFTFKLLLPEDESLKIQTEALALWCQGFLAGLGLSGMNLKDQENDEIKTALDDLANISQANYTELTESDDDEENFTEVLEYTRMVVLFIFTELRLVSEQQALQEHNETIH